MEIQHHLYSNVIIANIEIESVECGAELSHHHKTFHFISSVAVGIIWCMYAYGIWLHLVFHFHIIVNINTHANSSLDMRLKSKLHHLLIIFLPSRIHYQTMTLTSHPTFSICHYLMCLAEQQANIYWHSPSKGRGKAQKQKVRSTLTIRFRRSPTNDGTRERAFNMRYGLGTGWKMAQFAMMMLPDAVLGDNE